MNRFLDLSTKIDTLKRAKLKLEHKSDEPPPKVKLYFKSTGEEVSFKGADPIYKDYKLKIKEAKLKTIDTDIANWQKELDMVVEEARSICRAPIIDSNSTLARYAKMLDFKQQFKNLERMLTLKIFQRGYESVNSLKKFETDLNLRDIKKLSKANKASGRGDQEKMEDLVSTISDKVLNHISETINLSAPSNPNKRKRVESEDAQKPRTKKHKQTTLNNLTLHSNKGHPNLPSNKGHPNLPSDKGTLTTSSNRGNLT